MATGPTPDDSREQMRNLRKEEEKETALALIHKGFGKALYKVICFLLSFFVYSFGGLFGTIGENKSGR